MSTVAEQNQNGKATTGVAEHYEPQDYISPHVNIFEDGEGYVVEAEIPGVAREGVEIAVEATTLTITGRRQPLELKADELYRESSRRDYRRVFELDTAIDTAKIAAHLEQGVLRVTLPKSESVKPRKIAVNG